MYERSQMLALIIQIVPQCSQIYVRRSKTKEKEKVILTMEKKIRIRWPQAKELLEPLETLRGGNNYS